METKYNAVMVDLETISTRPDAAIIAIGAVRFWLNVKQTEFTSDQCFYTAVDLESCFHEGLSIDPKTIKWWMKQDDSARMALLNGVRLSVALKDFSYFVPSDKTFIFGNGSMFDNVILRNAYAAIGYNYPVSYKYDMCYRTLCKLSDSPLPDFEGTKHNALDDAKAQTRHLMELLEKHPWVKF